MDRPTLFIDTETTGLEPDADIWEFAGIRRDPSGSEERLHLLIEHGAACSRLPEPFRSDHAARFPHLGAVTQWYAAQEIREFVTPNNGDPKPIWVGSAPDFDAQRIDRLIDIQTGDARRWWPSWDHQLVGIVPLMLGYLAAKNAPLPGLLGPVETPMPEHKSEALSRAIGVNPDGFDRHTALGDVLWTQAIYDRIMGGAR